MAKTTAAELRNLDHDQLTERLTEYKEELFNLRFQAATGQLESHGRLRALRKDIARVYTVLTEREFAGLAADEVLVADGEGVSVNNEDSEAKAKRRGLRRTKAEKA